MQAMADASPHGTAGSADAETPYFTVAQAARRLRVSPSTIWRWIDAKKLRAYRIGEKTIRVRKEDLEAIVRPIDADSTADGVPAGSATMAKAEQQAPSGIVGLEGIARPRGHPLVDEEI